MDSSYDTLIPSPSPLCPPFLSQDWERKGGWGDREGHLRFITALPIPSPLYPADDSPSPQSSVWLLPDCSRALSLFTARARYSRAYSRWQSASCRRMPPRVAMENASSRSRRALSSSPVTPPQFRARQQAARQVILLLPPAASRPPRGRGGSCRPLGSRPLRFRSGACCACIK